MNLDDPQDHRQLNLRMDNYIITEVVAVPENFDIKSNLRMREQLNMFEIKNVNLDQLEKISIAVQYTPIFSSMNNPLLSPYSVMYYLNVLDELNLIIKSIHSPLRYRNQKSEYLEFCKNWNEEIYTYVRGQEVKRISFVIINIVQLLKQNVIDEAISSVNNLTEFQNQANIKIKELTEG